MSQRSTPPPIPPPDETTLADVKQLGLWAAIASLSYVFWVCGAMEMVERLAYYGVRAVATLYATRAESEGGLGVTMATFGTLLLCWNLMQSLIPVFTGGLSDRYGYKETIFASTVIKSAGYLVMALFHSYWGFFAGAMLLATGTAIFKPGVQGTLIKSTNRRNSSMAWGIFYQTVNIGGWIGPLIALQMRLLAWKYVFYINAGVICINFLLLLTYREPGKEERLARQQRLRAGTEKQRSLVLEALVELKKPHLALYLIIFSVWWLMFPMLWDVLPKYVEDWVDTAPMVQFLFGQRPATFSVNDVGNLPRFADKLKTTPRAMDLYLADRLSPETKAALRSYQGKGSDPMPLREALVSDLNRMLLDARLGETNHLKGVDLCPQHEQGVDLPHLNRFILEDAYPAELSRHPGRFWRFFLGMDAHGTAVQPEGIVNINAGMIMLTCFLFAGLGAKMRATTSMLLGTVLVVMALTLFGLTNFIGFAVLAMIIFSIGEMLASPKFSEFLGNIAPPDKKAMWIGFSQVPILVGWTIEGKLGPQLYNIFSSKDEFARQLLVQRGLTPAQVTEHALPIGEAFKKLVTVTGESPEHLTQVLYQSHHIGLTWYVFAAIGVASAVMIYFYGQWILTLARREAVAPGTPGSRSAEP